MLIYRFIDVLYKTVAGLKVITLIERLVLLSDFAKLFNELYSLKVLYLRVDCKVEYLYFRIVR